MLEARRLWEDSLRGENVDPARKALDHASRQPWFPHAMRAAGVAPLSQDEFEFEFDPAPLIRVAITRPRTTATAVLRCSPGYEDALANWLTRLR